MKNQNTIKIYASYTWSRGVHDYDDVAQRIHLISEKSYIGVTHAIDDWVKTWTGKGYVRIWYIGTTYSDNEKYCDIKQTVFRFDNQPSKPQTIQLITVK